jgi:hypothetical protein
VLSTFTLSLCIHNKKGSFPRNTTQHLGDASMPGHWALGAEEIQRACFCICNRKKSFPGNTTQYLGTARYLVTSVPGAEEIQRLSLCTLTRQSHYGHSLAHFARWLPNKTFHLRYPVSNLVPLMVTGSGFWQGESMSLHSLS